MGRKSKTEGIYAYVKLNHFAVQVKHTQHFKTTVLQFKKRKASWRWGREFFKLKKKDFSSGPVDKNPPANAEDGGSDPWFWKIPHASG